MKRKGSEIINNVIVRHREAVAMKRPRKFSTENADYYLNYGIHIRKMNIERIEDFDAIVLETGFYEYEVYSLRRLIGYIQYTDLIEKNLELDEPKSIFFVDLPSDVLYGLKPVGS